MKTNRRIITLGLLLTALSISACAVQQSNSNNQTKLEEQTIGKSIIADFGTHIKDRITLLFGTALIPFKINDYGISELIAGDYLEVSFTGEYMEYQTYPSTIDMRTITVTGMKLYEARMAEYELTPIPGSGDLDLVPTEEYKYYTMITAEYVINEDGSFLTKDEYLKTAEAGSKLYGSNPAIMNSFNVNVLYSYNPRPNHKNIGDNN